MATPEEIKSLQKAVNKAKRIATEHASQLHDLVEDTEYKIDFVEREFGTDVAYLVKVVTKQKKEHYEKTKA